MFCKNNLTTPAKPCYSPYTTWSNRRASICIMASVCRYTHIHILSQLSSGLLYLLGQSVSPSTDYIEPVKLCYQLPIVAGNNLLFHRCIDWSAGTLNCPRMGKNMGCLSNVREKNIASAIYTRLPMCMCLHTCDVSVQITSQYTILQ